MNDSGAKDRGKVRQAQVWVWFLPCESHFTSQHLDVVAFEVRVHALGRVSGKWHLSPSTYTQTDEVNTQGYTVRQVV